MNGSALASAHPWLSLPRALAWVAKRDADLALTVEPGERASSDVLLAVSPLFVWEAGKEAQRTAEWWGPFQPGREPAGIVNRAIAALQAALRSGAVAAKGVRGNVHESRGDDIEDISTLAWALLAIEHRAMILAAAPDRAAGSTLHTFWRGILIDTGSLVRAFPPPTDPIWLGRALSEGATLEDPAGGMATPAPDTVAPPPPDPDPAEVSTYDWIAAADQDAPSTYDWIGAWALSSSPASSEQVQEAPEVGAPPEPAMMRASPRHRPSKKLQAALDALAAMDPDRVKSRTLGHKALASAIARWCVERGHEAPAARVCRDAVMKHRAAV